MLCQVLSSPGLTEFSPQPFSFSPHWVGRQWCHEWDQSVTWPPPESTGWQWVPSYLLRAWHLRALGWCCADWDWFFSALFGELVPTAQLGVKSDAEEFTAASSVPSHPSSRPFTSCFSRCAPVYFVPLFLKVQGDFVELREEGYCQHAFSHPF